MFLLLFADDVVLVSSTLAGLQNQICNLQRASESWGLTVVIDKTKDDFQKERPYYFRRKMVS